MARMLNAENKRILAGISRLLTFENRDLPVLSDALFGQANPEDLAPFEPEALAVAVRVAAAMIADHRKGQSLVDVSSPDDFRCGDEQATLVTLVNDNMPFLLDSVLGEINDHTRDVLLVVHPILDVAREGEGYEIIDKSRPGLSREQTHRTSVIQIAIAHQPAETCADLARRLNVIMGQVRAAVRDWPAMLGRIAELVGVYAAGAVPLKQTDVREAMAFLEWLRDDNFTFLGIRDYDYTGNERQGDLVRSQRPALGVLSDPDFRILRRGSDPITITPEIRAFLNSREPLIVTKANAKSMVHRRGYLDYIGVKRYGDDGKLAGETRIVGLFTSTAYTKSVKTIPYLRSKVDTVMARSGHDPESHSGKALLNVLEHYPRDELFQIDTQTLARNSEAILALADRSRVRVLARPDPFDRFVSVLVHVPRDRYDSLVRQRIAACLVKEFDGRLSAFYPSFPEGPHARVHFIIGRSGGKAPKVSEAQLEADVRCIIHTWEDAWNEEIRRGGPQQSALLPLASSFPPSYREVFDAAQALIDARQLLRVDAQNTIAFDFYRDADEAENTAALRIYHHGAPVPLSARVPMLENLGFRVISEQTFELARPDGDQVYLHDMKLESGLNREIDLSDEGVQFEDALHAVWSGSADNDGYNMLVQVAGLPWREVSVLRAYGRYLRQAGIAYSPGLLADTLVRHPKVCRDLVELFRSRFDPAAIAEGDASERERAARQRIEEALAQVESLDEDTILRRFRNVIEATLRTNFWRPGPDGAARPSMAFKLDSRAVENLPEPKPFREIFVYGPQVEGVHLRFGPVARGGLRWSDRAEDYRTEVLGLVKAQQVKNAVIVPVGAKGGFFPRLLPPPSERDARFAAGRDAYITFVSSLLSVTDNIVEGEIAPPPHTIRHDGDDPYFVVAADKGTATFSDTANGIASECGFWLDDAFASGGSAGYDHKKMGITARGAWEAVKRHFREMGTDIQKTPFTVVGVGDMSGDVFGNGMLLSEKIRLVAAFDHRDIFIDPTPDPATSFNERRRMFALPRSSWQDYDKELVSKGGGVFPRSSKSITLTATAAKAIGLEKTVATPQEIMRAILTAPADLLWFGGIGTYVRSAGETDAEVGDRANDAIRITARQVRAKVIGEGANLGVTQRGRIEFGFAGGRCNSDAIDNSAGVNSSDVEVNIKIALAGPLLAGKLKRDKRDALLASMTDEVAELVLRNNYLQSLAISLGIGEGPAALALQSRFVSALEARGLLNRQVETLPGEQGFAERQIAGQTLTRAEFGVLLAYAKLVTFDDITASNLPDDPYFEASLLDYFPAGMGGRFASDIKAHRLRREIISTVLVNDAINRCGPTLVTRFRDATGMLPQAILRAYALVRDGFEFETINDGIDALDAKAQGDRQNVLYASVMAATRSALGAMLKQDNPLNPLSRSVESLRKSRAAIEPRLAEIAPAFMRSRMEEDVAQYASMGAPDELARRIALLPLSILIPDMMRIGTETTMAVERVAPVFFRVTEAFALGRIERAAQNIAAPDYYDGLAVSRSLDLIGEARRRIAVAALSRRESEDPVEAWIAADAARIGRVRTQIASLIESGDMTLSRLTVAAGLLNDLAA